MEENEVAKEIVDAAFKTHVAMGPGLLESVYETVLFHEINKRGLKCYRQVGFNVIYDGKAIGEGFRADLIVENKVIVEIKSVEEIASIHLMQLKTYLTIANKRLGLLINFNTELIKDGIKRVVNRMPG